MTGMAALSGSTGPYDWSIELRGVNNKSLDIRTRVPDWLIGLDQLIRKSISNSVTRGSLQFSLKISVSEALSGQTIDIKKLSNILENASIVSEQAAKNGLSVSPISLADIASQNGFTDFESTEE
ncbi:YicC family protein, partial [Planktomarina sp.]|nr:YicC family protein [Planktomarina sp.]